MNLQTLCPEINPNQLKALHRLIAEQVIQPSEVITEQDELVHDKWVRNDLRADQRKALDQLFWNKGEE